MFTRYAANGRARRVSLDLTSGFCSPSSGSPGIQMIFFLFFFNFFLSLSLSNVGLLT